MSELTYFNNTTTYNNSMYNAVVSYVKTSYATCVADCAYYPTPKETVAAILDDCNLVVPVSVVTNIYKTLNYVTTGDNV